MRNQSGARAETTRARRSAESRGRDSSATRARRALGGLLAAVVIGAFAAPFTLNVEAAFAACPAPTVTVVNPTAGPLGGGTPVTITGTNFGPNGGCTTSGVKFGANAATSFTVNSPTQITATSPAGAAGIVDITVTTNGGTSATGASDRFTYTAAPTVTSVSPTSGPSGGGTSVSITGTNFVNVSTSTGVKFGSTNATGITALSLLPGVAYIAHARSKRTACGRRAARALASRSRCSTRGSRLILI